MSKIYSVCLALATLVLAGCGSKSSPSTPPPTQVRVILSQTSATINVGGTLQFSATVQGTTNTAVTWSVDGVVGGNATSGPISSGGLYQAPSRAGAHTVTATSVADTSKSADAQITVSAPSTITISVTPPSATVSAGATAQFTATVQGTANTSVDWSVDGIGGGNTSVGQITAAGLYTAPSQAGTHTVMAASVADSTKSATATVTVTTSITLSVSPVTATVAPNGTQQFTSSAPATWSVDGVAGGSSSTGTISSSGLYKAPATMGPHKITATSTANSAVTATSYLTVINAAQAAVLSYHNDDARDGAYLEELTLNPANVNSTQFGKLLSYHVDGQIYAQPLYLPQVNIPGLGTRDVVFVATQNNSIYAFDADATAAQPTTFWQLNFGPSVHKGDIEGVNPVVGILSTPVIDATTKTIYLVDESSNGTGLFHLHALDVATGAEKFGGPVTITGTVNGSGLDSSGGKVTLESDCYQRMGLALNPVSNAIYIPFGSCNHGWVFAYDKTTLAQKATIFNSTADSGGGAFWASGGAPAIDDSTGDLFLMSGSDFGDQNYITNSTQIGYNNSFINLSTNLTVQSYFSPDDNYTLALNDADLGSGSPILVPGNSQYPKELIGGGKDGNIFVNNPLNMGGFNDSSNTVLQTVHIGTTQYNNIFSTPAYWNGVIYFHSNADPLRAFTWDASATAGQQMSLQSAALTSYGMHGATPSVSANGNNSGIVWDIDNSAYVADDPGASGPSVLHAYDATNVAHELYNSAQIGARDSAGIALKFTVPTIANGRVYVPTASELDIYGLLGH